MNLTTYDNLIESDLFAYIKGLRAEKAKEYAADHDTLMNFHRAAPFLGLTPAQYCIVLLVKHIQGIAKQIMEGEWLWEYRTESGGEGLKQRIADGINYLALLFAMLHEEHEGREAAAQCQSR